MRTLRKESFCLGHQHSGAYLPGFAYCAPRFSERAEATIHGAGNVIRADGGPYLQSLDDFQKVIYIGTFSKMLSPAIRCAYMVLPWSLVDRFEENYRYFNAMIPAYHEKATAEMIDSGSLEKHLRNLGIADEGKYGAMSKYLKAYLPEYVEILGEPAGVHTMVKIHGCTDQKGLLAFLEKRSIRIYGIKEHCHDQINAYEDTFLLGYNAMTQDELEEGCRALAAALDEYFGDRRGNVQASVSRSLR